MRVGVIQSAYVPWRGYFDFIRSVDLFLFYDDVQYSKGTWRNRNRLKTVRGLRWLTVPVRVHLGLTIEDVEIASDEVWQPLHRRLIQESLSQAPHFAEAVELWEGAIRYSDTRLSDLNVRLTRGICAYLQINTPLRMSCEFGAEGRSTERLISLLRNVGATTYLSGPTGRGYLDEALFRRNGIRLEYKSYDYPPYPQQWGAFEPAVSILDLIANVGPSAPEFLTSRSPDSLAPGSVQESD